MATTWLDCLRCGACCANTDENRAEGFVDYVEVFRHDDLRKRPDLLGQYSVRNALGEIHLKLDAEHKCVALDGVIGQSVHCRLYAHRPTVCKRVQVGSQECLRARRERGVDPPREVEADGGRGRGIGRR